MRANEFNLCTFSVKIQCTSQMPMELASLCSRYKMAQPDVIVPNLTSVIDGFIESESWKHVAGSICSTYSVPYQICVAS